MSKEIQAYYTFANLTISISITKFEDMYSIQHEKDDNPVEMYIFNGICHYFSQIMDVRQLLGTLILLSVQLKVIYPWMK